MKSWTDRIAAMRQRIGEIAGLTVPISAEEFAKGFGVSADSVYRWMRGDMPSRKNQYRLIEIEKSLEINEEK